MAKTANEPARRLIFAIVAQGVKDLKIIYHRSDALTFFRSSWGADLCDLTGYDPEAIIQAVDRHPNKKFKLTGNF